MLLERCGDFITREMHPSLDKWVKGEPLEPVRAVVEVPLQTGEMLPQCVGPLDDLLFHAGRRRLTCIGAPTRTQRAFKRVGAFRGIFPGGQVLALQSRKSADQAVQFAKQLAGGRQDITGSRCCLF